VCAEVVIYRPKRVEITGDWRKLHNKELHDFLLLTRYYSGDQINED
jgi:hypothetical protein